MNFIHLEKKSNDNGIFGYVQSYSSYFTVAKDGVKKVKRLVYILIILVVLFGCVAVAVVLGISKGKHTETEDKSSVSVQQTCLSQLCANQVLV